MTISYTKFYQCDRCQFAWTEGDTSERPTLEIIVREDNKFIWGSDIKYVPTKLGYESIGYKATSIYGHLCASCTLSFLEWAKGVKGFKPK